MSLISLGNQRSITMATAVRMITVDAFTESAFSGNPAGVCLPDHTLSDELYQKIATEMNVSETAFVRPFGNGDFQTSDKFLLRWFTPTNEVPFCGHGTLASAYVLFNVLKNNNSVINFETKRGELRCSKSGSKIQLDFPESPLEEVKNLEPFRGIIREAVGDLPVKDVYLDLATKKLLIVLEDRITKKQVESLRPNIATLHQQDPKGELVKGVSVTLKGSKENGCLDKNGKQFDFVSRYFTPWNGIPEDPVTGSLHCALAPYWSMKLGKNQLYANQCSPRGGILHLEMRGDGRVYILGDAVTVLKGEMFI